MNKEFLKELSRIDSIQRLKDISMNCGIHYTKIAGVCRGESMPTMYDYSLEVAKLTYKLTESKLLAICGVLTTVNMPVFPYDFTETCRPSEDAMIDFINKDKPLLQLLNKYNIPANVVIFNLNADILSNERNMKSIPRLIQILYSARLLDNLTITIKDDIYENLSTITDDDGKDALCFKDVKLAKSFMEYSIKETDYINSDLMNYLANRIGYIIYSARYDGVLTDEDLCTTEAEVIQKLTESKKFFPLWLEFCGIQDNLELSKVMSKQQSKLTEPCKDKQLTEAYVMFKGYPMDTGYWQGFQKSVEYPYKYSMSGRSMKKSEASLADRLVKAIAEVGSKGVPIKVSFAEDLDTVYEIYKVCTNPDGSVSIIIKQSDGNYVKPTSNF